MAKTGEKSTKNFQKETESTWLDVSKNTNLEAVLVDLEARTHGLDGVSAIYVQVEGKLVPFFKAGLPMREFLNGIVPSDNNAQE